MNKKIIIESQKDNIIGANYALAMINAKELSGYLKSGLSKNGVNYNKFNSEFSVEKSWLRDEQEVLLEKNPPKEIYEYQNFFLLEKETGEYVLLDGFRRLLWYNAPDANIFVRIYKRSDLSDSQIFNLMIYLNHFKFYGQGDYHDRGFALFLNSVFGLSIYKYREAFDSYLSNDEIKNDYSFGDRKEGAEKNHIIKERILNPMFISDMRFLEALNEAGCMIDKFMGALSYLERKNDGAIEFSVDKFIALVKENKVLESLMVKYRKVGTDSSAQSQKIVNQIIEIYQNIFKAMRGGKVGKSYAEKMDDCKALSKEIQKDKNWTKLTGAQDVHFVENIMERIIRAEGKSKLGFKCIVYPDQEEEPAINCGLHSNVKFKEFVKARSYGAREEMEFVFPLSKNELSVCHNYGGYYGYGKKYTTIEGYEKKGHGNRIVYDIDLFVNVPKSEVDGAKNAWKAENKKNSDAHYAGIAKAEAEEKSKAK